MLKALNQGISELGLSLSAQQIQQLVDLQTQLLKWNKVYNLTAIKTADQALKVHLLDSLSIVPLWNFQITLDVGTGAGFPGLPLAIALPQQEFHLLDSNGKKVRFIRQQIHELGLTNVFAHHCRVEDHQPECSEGYDSIVSRAFASINDMLVLTAPLLKPQGRWMAMKSVFTEEERASLPADVVEKQTHLLNIPGLDAKRCLIELARRND